MPPGGAFSSTWRRPLPCSRAAISDAIGLTEESESSRAVDIRIMRLRKKIEDDPSNPKFLRTMRGEGYIFSLPDESAH